MGKKYEILNIDPHLEPFANEIDMRMERYENMKNRLDHSQSLSAFANGYLYFGFHKETKSWVYREWAPNASAIHLIGDFNGWNRNSHPLTSLDDGAWEIFIEGQDSLKHGEKIKIQISTDNGVFDRIPLYCKRVLQDKYSKDFYGQIWCPDEPFHWNYDSFSFKKSIPPLIYECHIGMASENEGVSTYEEFTKNVLPRIYALGYNTIQLMAVMEHPYYGSFGYQVTNFFAVSSRFGTPEQLKELIDTAHSMDIAVLLDIVHSHAASNVLEGLSLFDGTDYQFFHRGEKGNHPAWGTKIFDYSKPEVIHFLLSNVKFWLVEYHFDGFRFDGVTSMLYHSHGLGTAFDSYNKYFSMDTDVDAITYLQLASMLTKEVKSDAILIAEDMSGMPGMCLPVEWGGIGFDYRLSMGMPDFWIQTLKTTDDEHWDIGRMWHELNTRRPKEKVIGYCESHDQALVGDKTIMFWLADSDMYWHMGKNTKNYNIERAMELHKIIRFISCLCAGNGYLNFMGNEFGHPEWIDFPREGNNWSYHYARRGWSLVDDKDLLYYYLRDFDEYMIHLVKENNILSYETKLLHIHWDKKIVVFMKSNYLFAFNFGVFSREHVLLPVPEALKNKTQIEMVINTNWTKFGGYTEESNPAIINSGYVEFYVDKRCGVGYCNREK